MKLFVQTFICALTRTPMAAFPARVEASPNAHAILREFNKVVSSNGIDEAKAIEIGGIRQWITVRGRDRRNHIRQVELFQRRRNQLLDDALVDPFIHHCFIGHQHAVERQVGRRQIAKMHREAADMK